MGWWSRDARSARRCSPPGETVRRHPLQACSRAASPRCLVQTSSIIGPCAESPRYARLQARPALRGAVFARSSGRHRESREALASWPSRPCRARPVYKPRVAYGARSRCCGTGLVEASIVMGCMPLVARPFLSWGSRRDVDLQPRMGLMPCRAGVWNADPRHVSVVVMATASARRPTWSVALDVAGAVGRRTRCEGEGELNGVYKVCVLVFNKGGTHALAMGVPRTP